MTRHSLIASLVLSWFIGVGLLGCGQDQAPEIGCNFVQNSAKQRVSWAGTSKVYMRLHKDYPDHLIEATLKAAETWNTQLQDTELVVLTEDRYSANSSPAWDGANVLYYSTDLGSSWYGDQAKTSVKWRGDKIQEIDMEINGTHYNYGTKEVLEDNQHDYVSLLVHEFGHVLGLDHIDDPDSVMHKTLSVGEYRRNLLVGTDDASASCEYKVSDKK